MKINLEHPVVEAAPNIAKLAASLSGLSKARVKDAMSKGALSLKRGKQTRRIRRAETAVKSGDILYLNYDESLLALKPPMISCLEDRMGYSIWFKPAGVMSQGNQYGDHMSILRIVEKQLHQKREVFPVHRLDRETRGLVMVAHNKKMAATLSTMFQQHQIEKGYQAIVLGKTEASGKIDIALDGKQAVTHFTRIGYDEERGTSQVDIQLETGRTHQIRRHFEQIGHPLMGDPKYGSGNKNRQGLLLVAYKLSFLCPIRKDQITLALPDPFPSKGF